MTRFAQPLLSLLVGIALVSYGAVHAVTHIPASQNIQIFWSAMPSFGSVLLFLVGVIAVFGGLSLLTSGVQGLKRRKHQLAKIYARVPEPFEEDEEREHQPSYYC